MGRRAAVPRLSVVLTAEGAPQYALRAVESLQNQNVHDLQIVIAHANLAPGVLHALTTVADRDIHVDLIDAGEVVHAACLQAGVDAARGARIILMGADDWFGPGALNTLIDAAQDTDADVVFPQVLRDRYDAHRERHSHSLSLGNCMFANRRELAGGIERIIASDLISCQRGVMVRSDILSGALSASASLTGVSFVSQLLTLAQSAASVEDAIFHTPAETIAEVFDPAMFSRACDDLACLKSLLETFGIGGAASVGPSLACERRFYGYLVASIENLCLSPHSVSSIERNARLRDMLLSESTRTAIAALAPLHKELGPMWKPVSSARPFSCVLRAHVADFFNLSVNKTA